MGELLFLDGTWQKSERIIRKISLVDVSERLIIGTDSKNSQMTEWKGRGVHEVNDRWLGLTVQST